MSPGIYCSLMAQAMSVISLNQPLVPAGEICCKDSMAENGGGQNSLKENNTVGGKSRNGYDGHSSTCPLPP